MWSHPPNMSFSTDPHPNKLAFLWELLAFASQTSTDSSSADLTWVQDTLHCSRAARVFLPSTELSIQSLLVNWSTDHMLFQANDDIREYNPWVATAAAPGKHNLCYSSKREEESFQNSPSLCPSEMIFLLLASGFIVNIRARYCCHWDLVNLVQHSSVFTCNTHRYSQRWENSSCYSESLCSSAVCPSNAAPACLAGNMVQDFVTCWETIYHEFKSALCFCWSKWELCL